MIPARNSLIPVTTRCFHHQNAVEVKITLMELIKGTILSLVVSYNCFHVTAVAAVLCSSNSFLFFQARLISLYFDTKRYQEALALGECLEILFNIFVLGELQCLFSTTKIFGKKSFILLVLHLKS